MAAPSTVNSPEFSHHQNHRNSVRSSSEPVMATTPETALTSHHREPPAHLHRSSAHHLNQAVTTESFPATTSTPLHPRSAATAAAHLTGTTVIHAAADREPAPATPHTNATATAVRLRPPQFRQHHLHVGEAAPSRTTKGGRRV